MTKDFDEYNQHNAINEYGISNNRHVRNKKEAYDSDFAFNEMLESIGVRRWRG
jgi:hypothetical protein